MGNLTRYTTADLPALMDRITKNSIGMDEYFDRLFNLHETTSNYPPYNLVTISEVESRLELALAGFNKKDIEVEYKENLLTVKSKKQEETKDEDGNIIHRGISKRMFSKSFTIANDVEVKGAELKDGLLKVSLERIIPEHKKAKTIDIK